MALGQNLSVGSTVAIYGPGGGGYPYPAIVTWIMSPTGVSSRLIHVVAHQSNPAAPVVLMQNINHRSLSADGSGWDFSSTFPAVAL